MLYLSAVFLAFFLTFLLFTKRNKTHADYVLAGWLATTGVHLLMFYLFSSRWYNQYPTLIVMSFALPLVQGPYLYLYTRLQTSSENFHLKHLLHFLPVLLSWLLFTRFYSLPFEQKTDVFNHYGKGFETELNINLFAIYISGIVYTILSLMRLMKYRRNMVQQFSNTEKINFNWLLYLILWIIVIWAVILITQKDEFIYSSAALFVIWLGYFGIKQVQVFTHRPAPGKNDDVNDQSSADDSEIIELNPLDDSSTTAKYQKSTLTDEDASLIHERLKNLMNEQKPFTNPDLTLNELAKNLSVHPNTLSQVINTKENRSFYDLINQKRVDEFINLISKPGNQQFTFLGLAFDCGFNSKASFNRNFKKYTGLSPRDYLKQRIAA